MCLTGYVPDVFVVATLQEQCKKLRDEREGAMRDLAVLRCDRSLPMHLRLTGYVPVTCLL
jgi:hypothetical protein